jgi:hypothetical protein
VRSSRNERNVGQEMRHGVRQVVTSQRNVGFPHEEGEDCPFCPFWRGKQGGAASERNASHPRGPSHAGPASSPDPHLALAVKLEKPKSELEPTP